MRQSAAGELRVGQKPGRTERIAELVGRLLATKPPNRNTAETLRGVLGFARAQCFGRCGAIALHYLADIVSGRTTRVEEEGADLLRFWPTYVAEAKPRTISTRDTRRPVVIFTDGAEEGAGTNTSVGVGAVMIDPERTDTRDLLGQHPHKKLKKNGAEGRETFGGLVPPSVVEAWRRERGTTKVIHQAELYPALLALRQWGGTLEGRRLILFVDNEPARAALVKGTTTAAASARIVNDFWALAARLSIYLWVERVASKSNPADDPSRNEWAWLKAKGFVVRVCRELDGF